MADDKKISKKFDNLVTGVIIGGAIGSVLGLTLAPRKGSETRKMIKEKGEEMIEKGKDAGEDFLDEHHETISAAKNKMERGKKGLFKWVKKLVKSI